MDRLFRRFSSTGIILLLLRFTLFLFKSFVTVGEVVSFIPTKLWKIVRAHTLALMFIVRHLAKSVQTYATSFPHIVRNRFLTAFQDFRRIAGSLRLVNKHHIRFFLNVVSMFTRRTKNAFLRIAYNVKKNASLLRRIHIVLPRIRIPPIPHINVFNTHPKRVPKHTPIVIKPHPIRGKYLRLRILAFIIILTVFGSATYMAYDIYIKLPRPRDIGHVNYALTTHVYDRNGRLLFDFFKDQKRTPIKLSNLPMYVAQATIAIEDKDFYRHKGVSILSGVARAVRETYINQQGIQGGSTITQQLVKTALLSPERTLTRKIKEVIIALETERVFTKDEILEMYLNQVPYGGSVYGIQEASRTIFNKDAQALTLSEAALLAGLPQAPTTYSPFTNLKGAIQRRNQVLTAMREQGYITENEFSKAASDKVKIASNAIPIEAPHFVFFVRNFLQQDFEVNELYQGGLKVQTTLDLDIQKAAEKILQEELAKVQYLNVTNGAVLVTRPSTGEILAMVGSANFFDGKSGEFNVITGLRQPGSSIKPIVYLRGMEQGLTAASIIDDSPTIFQIGTTEVYRPVNYDGRFHGRVTARFALANSYNIPAVKVISKIGVADFIDFAKDAGIDTWESPDNYGLSLALGGGDVTMVDMAEAYSTLANGGYRTNLNPIQTITYKDGDAIRVDEPESEHVVDESYAYIISDILSDNQARLQAFGPGSALEVPGYKVAVKTGTTDEKRDNWTIGYTPEYLVVVWVGNNDRSPMNPYLASGITGAAPIWNRVMKYLLDTTGAGEKRWYTRPSNVVQKSCMGRNEYFVAGTENSVPCVLPKPPKSVAQKDENSNP